MIKRIVFTLLAFISIAACAQAQVSVSFSRDSPKKVDAGLKIELYVELSVSGIEQIAELVVAKAAGNTEPTILNKLSLLKDNDGYYLTGGQRIYHGLIRYNTSFRKDEIRDNANLVFFVVDKSGVRSTMVSYSLNP